MIVVYNRAKDWNDHSYTILRIWWRTVQSYNHSFNWFLWFAKIHLWLPWVSTGVFFTALFKVHPAWVLRMWMLFFPKLCCRNIPTKIGIITGWWLGHPSEKYEFVNWDDNRNPILMGKFKKWQPVTTVTTNQIWHRGRMPYKPPCQKTWIDLGLGCSVAPLPPQIGPPGDGGDDSPLAATNCV